MNDPRVEWCPIDEATAEHKDGRYLLLWDGTGPAFVGMWEAGHDGVDLSDRVRIPPRAGRWITDGEGFDCDPTHFRFLPEGPNAER